MPKVAELKKIDGHVWARLEMAGDAGSVTLWTEAEKEAACHAYVTALAQDEAIMETMCRAFAPEVPPTVKGIHYETEWSRLNRKMRAALSTLTAKE